MNPNSKYRALAYLLTLAFLLPIVIKAQHMMFPNHEHHAHSCCHHESGLLEICEIQDFDYFYFTQTEIIYVPNILSFQLTEQEIESTRAVKTELRFDYGLRAPPYLFKH